MLITDRKELESFYTGRRVWQGIPGIERTKNGRIFLCFYSGGTKEGVGNYAVIVKSENGKDFGEPVAAVKKEGDFRCFDPVLWTDPLGRLWFIWNVMPGEEVWAVLCDDPDAEELTWGKEFYIGRGVMLNKPTVLTSGEWLFPIAIWKPDVTRTLTNLRALGIREDDVPGSYVYKTSDNGKSFERLGYADVNDRSFDEHMVLEKKNGALMMLVRTKYGIGVSCSYDRGINWSKGENSGLGGPCSRFFVRRLSSGRVLLINHFKNKGRSHLAAFLSEDDGITYPYSLLLDERAGVSYPDAAEGEDGYIYITYDRSRGCFKSSLEEVYACPREILTAKITEQDIIKGELVTEGSFLKNVASALTVLDSDVPDPFPEKPVSDTAYARVLAESGRQDILEAIFERYPIDCAKASGFDFKYLDMLIDRFKNGGSKDVQLLSEIIAFVREAPQSKKLTYPIVEKVQDYIERNMQEEISASGIAEDMNISVYYLCHLFKNVTGITVTEYVSALRIARSKQLLVASEYTVSEIAQKTGFSSSSYFSEVFARSEKISPSEYRRYHK